VINRKHIFYYVFFLSTSTHTQEQIGFLYAHGLGRCKQDIHYYAGTNWNIINGPHWAFNFDDVIQPGIINAAKVTIGQHGDCLTLHNNHKEFIHNHALKEIVLIGSSRGAATIINYLGLYQPENVRAAILESPFDSVESVVQHKLNRMNIGWIPGTVTIAHFIVASYFMYPAYNWYGPQPITSIPTIAKNIPLLFIHSCDDMITPVYCSQLLSKIARDNGNNDVYYLELSSATHGQYQLSHEAQKYQDIVHAFYQRYNIPHDPAAAARGLVHLDACRL
jgi:fermentation-respiration switch protein FrsA (DUF1100 family)